MAQKPPRRRPPNPSTPLLAVFAAVLALGCRDRGKKPDPELDQRTGCRSACAALSGSGPGGLDVHAGCVARCMVSGTRAKDGGCRVAFRDYLSCVSRSAAGCSGGLEPGACLEQGRVGPGCRAAYTALETCLGPCTHAGSVSTVDAERDGGGRLRAVLVRAGCGACPQAAPGAPLDSPCQAASVCGEVCCACPDGRAHFMLRACVAGRCRSSEQSCRAARQAAAFDPCSGRPQ